MKKPELILVNLLNGDSAVFLNGHAVYNLEAWEIGRGEFPSSVAESLAEALGITLRTEEMEAPADEEWNWESAYELLPAPETADTDVDAVTVTHWDSARYSDIESPRAKYTMRVSDQRVTHGQMFIDIEPIEGHLDDNGLSVVLEINNTPGNDESHVPSVHVAFGTGNTAFSVFQEGLDKLILRPENGVRFTSEPLSDRETIFLIHEENERNPSSGSDLMPI